MYEETIAGLRRIVNNHKGRLTPFMRETICEAVEAIKKLSRFKEECDGCGDKARSAIEKLQKNTPHWIPVTERLPEKDGMYLVHGAWSASGRKATDTCEFHVHDGYFRATWDFDVTHWMPLPGPPEEDKP